MAVAAESDVFVSPDDGDNWQLASGGLPRMPHGSDVRFGTWGGEDAAFLGTWGRSMWIVPVEEAIAPGEHRLYPSETRWRSIRDPASEKPLSGRSALATKSRQDRYSSRASCMTP